MSLRILATASLALAVIVGACGPAATTSAPTAAAAPTTVTPTVTPTTAATAPATPAATTAAGAATVEAKAVGSIGTVLVAGSNGMTVYTFTMDVKDSGKSACVGACIANWPVSCGLLRVPATLKEPVA